MSATRQQRRNNARGTVPFKPLATAPALTWAWGYVDPTHAKLTLGDVTGRLQLNGVPQIVATPFGGTATAATIAGNVVTLTFGSSINAAGALTVPQKDPALRTSTGSYLGGGTSSASIRGPASVNTWGNGAHPTGDVGVADNTASGLSWTLDVPPAGIEFFVIQSVGASGSGNDIAVLNWNGSPIAGVGSGEQGTYKFDGTNWTKL